MIDWHGIAAVAETAPMPDPFRAWGLLDCAATLAELGVPVFPLQPGSKQPHPGSSGCKDATTDLARVERWWDAHPGDNIGLATGHGLDVLDVDCKNGQPGYDTLRRALPLLPAPAVTVRTPTGGLHLWYASNGEGNHAGLAGLDYRGAGGYVLAPGSRTRDGLYEWGQWAPPPPARAPAWNVLQASLSPQRRPATQLPARAGSGGLEALQRHVAALTEGNRNAGLYWAAKRAVTEGHNPDELRDPARAAGLPDHEITATINSARRETPQ